MKETQRSLSTCRKARILNRHLLRAKGNNPLFQNSQILSPFLFPSLSLTNFLSPLPLTPTEDFVNLSQPLTYYLFKFLYLMLTNWDNLSKLSVSLLIFKQYVCKCCLVINEIMKERCILENICLRNICCSNYSQ